MALKYSKRFYLLLNKNYVKSRLPILGNNAQPQIQITVHYSKSAEGNSARLNDAIKSYLEKAKKYDEFIKQQLEEYNLGKEFLASMMGRKSRTMTQEEVDEAIEYLFPSRLFVPKTRPLMKEPLEIFKSQKEASFDLTGRPYHFLYYTAKPNFYQCLHDAALKLEELNSLYINPKNPPKQLFLIKGKWLTIEELKKKFNENLLELEYEKFVEVLDTLAKHPYAFEAEEFIKNYIHDKGTSRKVEEPEDIVCIDGVKTITIPSLKNGKDLKPSTQILILTQKSSLQDLYSICRQVEPAGFTI